MVANLKLERGDKTPQKYIKIKYKPQGGKEAFTITCPPYPTPAGWQKYWTDLCSMVSTRSSHPAYALQWMFEIETAESIADLRNDKKLDTLSSKLRLGLMAILRGQIVNEIFHEDAKLKISCGGQLKGRQIAWMLRERFKLDAEEGMFYSSRELMDLRLEKDNVPGYLTAWGGLCLNIDLPAIEKEIVFSREIERSAQLEVVFTKYNVDCVRNRKKYKELESKMYNVIVKKLKQFVILLELIVFMLHMMQPIVGTTISNIFLSQRKPRK